MILIKRITSALVAGMIFFLAEVVIAIVLGYFVLRLHGLKYDFYMVSREGIRFGLYLGGVISFLAFVGNSRRNQP